jgi:putative hydrolase of the HAD superfamily
MWFDTAIIDLDGTLYDYEAYHKRALYTVLKNLSEMLGVGIDQALEAYKVAAEKVKLELGNSASSHNRLIYFTKICRQYSLPPSYAFELSKQYWMVFYENIRPFEGALELLDLFKQKKVRVLVLTDFESSHQYEKLNRLNLLPFIDDVLTSEEIGVDKPCRTAFERALSVASTSPERATVIGDSLSRDVRGAYELGISGFHISADRFSELPNNWLSFATVMELYEWMIEFCSVVEDVAHLSRKFGSRFDLVQAAGGNISGKLGAQMVIKASGVRLGDVTTQKGLAYVDCEAISVDFSNDVVRAPSQYCSLTANRPSIETYMHAILGRYVVHLHPIELTSILSAEGGREFVRQILPSAAVVPYATPGIHLAKLLTDEVRSKQIIFLLNHGLIIHGESAKLVEGLVWEVIQKFAGKGDVIDAKGLNLSTELSTRIGNCLGEIPVVRLVSNTYISTKINTIRNLRLSFPDAVVYLGSKILDIEYISEDSIEQFVNKYGIPSIILIGNRVFVAGRTLASTMDVEEMLSACVAMHLVEPNQSALSREEVKFLSNWESEIFRRSSR